MSDGDEITVTADGPVRIVTLNRPDVLNNISETLHRRLSVLWSELADDLDARSVVLTGAGRAFCAGGDLTYLRRNYVDAATRDAGIRFDRRIQTEMMRFPLPIIAAVNGPAVGLGCSLALGCDLVLMADTAYLADPHVSIGLVAGDGGVTIWPLLTSMLRVKEFLFTGDRVTAEEALTIGLCNRVVAPGRLMAEALALAHRLAAQPALALRSTKAALAVAMETASRGAMEAALVAERETMTSSDYRRLVDELAQSIAARQAAGQAEDATTATPREGR